MVALKIQKSAPHYTDTAIDEIELLTCCERGIIENHSLHVVQLLDDFRIYNSDGSCRDSVVRRNDHLHNVVLCETLSWFLMLWGKIYYIGSSATSIAESQLQW